jgi:hypothetical protein
VLTDNQGHHLVFRGDDLVFEGGVFTGGTVSQVLITNSADEIYVNAQNVNREAVKRWRRLNRF